MKHGDLVKVKAIGELFCQTACIDWVEYSRINGVTIGVMFSDGGKHEFRPEDLQVLTSEHRPERRSFCEPLSFSDIPPQPKPQPTDDPIRRKFWCDVFLKVCEPSDFHNASIEADIALEEYDKRFNQTESK